VIRESSVHHWRNAQCLVNPAEIVKHVMQRNGMAMVVNLFAMVHRSGSAKAGGFQTVTVPNQDLD